MRGLPCHLLRPGFRGETQSQWYSHHGSSRPEDTCECLRHMPMEARPSPPISDYLRRKIINSGACLSWILSVSRLDGSMRSWPRPTLPLLRSRSAYRHPVEIVIEVPEPGLVHVAV